MQTGHNTKQTMQRSCDTRLHFPGQLLICRSLLLQVTPTHPHTHKDTNKLHTQTLTPTPSHIQPQTQTHLLFQVTSAVVVRALRLPLLLLYARVTHQNPQ